MTPSARTRRNSGYSGVRDSRPCSRIATANGHVARSAVSGRHGEHGSQLTLPLSTVSAGLSQLMLPVSGRRGLTGGGARLACSAAGQYTRSGFGPGGSAAPQAGRNRSGHVPAVARPGRRPPQQPGWTGQFKDDHSGHGDDDLPACVAGGAGVMGRGGLLQRERGVQGDGEAALIGQVRRQRQSCPAR